MLESCEKLWFIQDIVSLSERGTEMMSVFHIGFHKCSLHRLVTRPCIVGIFLIAGGLYSEIALRKTKSKGTVYSRHQSKTKVAPPDSLVLELGPATVVEIVIISRVSQSHRAQSKEYRRKDF
jgi:hypothetical protein